MQTRRVILQPPSDGSLEDLDRVETELNLQSHLLFTFLDNQDYLSDSSIPEDFLVRAFYWNRERNEVKSGTPADVALVMNWRDCKHLVYLSARACQEERIQFTWIFAHELQHLRQTEDITRVGELQRALLEMRDEDPIPPTQTALEKPRELDCELIAKNIVVRLFGQTEVDDFIARQRSSSANAETYFTRFDEIEQFLRNRSSHLLDGI